MALRDPNPVDTNTAQTGLLEIAFTGQSDVKCLRAAENPQTLAFRLSDIVDQYPNDSLKICVDKVMLTGGDSSVQCR
jgi:hypothetical protein